MIEVLLKNLMMRMRKNLNHDDEDYIQLMLQDQHRINKHQMDQHINQILKIDFN